MTKTELEKLAQALSYFDYAKEREADFNAPSKVDPTVILKRGIGDLDFDPVYYLGTEQTSPEGWAKR